MRGAGGKGMQIIYADVLVIVNLAMDFLTLYLTGRIARRTRQPSRMLAAAAIGGLWGVGALFLEELPLLSAILQVGISFLMCFVAYGRPILGVTALFWGIGCLLGGGMTALFTAVNRFRGEGLLPAPAPQAPPIAKELTLGLLGVLALLCAAGALLMAGLTRRRQMAGEVSLRILFDGRELKAHGIVDSANFLTEPLSGMPVILLPLPDGRRLFPPALRTALTAHTALTADALPRALARRVRIVPSVGAFCEGMLLAVRPDLCEIEGSAADVYIALCDIPHALVPSDAAER